MPNVLAVAGALFAMFTACGGGNMRPPDETPPELAAGFAGIWEGEALIEVDGTHSFSIPYMLWNDIPEGTSLPIYTPCPAGDGEIVAQGAGLRARWDGRLECAPVATTTCEAVHVVLYQMDLAYDLNRDELTVTGQGSLHGCGIGPVPMSLYMLGHVNGG